MILIIEQNNTMPLIKDPEQIELMKISGEIAGRILQEVASTIEPGKTTMELDNYARELIEQNGVKPAFLNYQGFPGVMCTSVNDVVGHGAPSKTPLKEGDILSLDFGVIYKGWYSDTAITIPVGEVSHEAKRIIQVTKRALRLGIKKAKPGSTTGDIGNTVQRYVEGEGYSVVRELVGHGVGTELHEKPTVPNYGKRKSGTELQEGMVIAIEPMIVAGEANLKLDDDGFGYKPKDKSLTAHFEHTVAITKKGGVVLTESKE